jgi:hypothetical protein
VVLKVILGVEDPSSGDGDWNVVQNNGISSFLFPIPSIAPYSNKEPYTGARAAQIIPHIHFHVIPRPATDKVMDLRSKSWTMFGRGQREELDDEEGEELIIKMREELGREVERVEREEGVRLGGLGVLRGKL